MLTLTEATEQTGKSKSTLVRAIKSGKLSAQRNEHGDYRVEPSELFRVYKSVTHHDEPVSAPETQSAVVADLLEMVKTKDSENADLRGDLDDTRQRLQEHREAARSLMSPDEFEAKLKQEAEKLVSEESARLNTEWEMALQERQQEIQAARSESADLRTKRQEELKQSEELRKRLREIESRGLLARLFNRKPTAVG
jgi:chromosome segregation ATPase